MKNKKICPRTRLVSIHKLFAALVLIFLWAPAHKAQNRVWTLEECIDTARVYNKSLQIGRNNVSAGEERYKEAIAGLIPKINFTADYKYFTALPYQLMPMSTFGGPPGKFKETQFGVPHNINGSIQASVPLYSPQIYGAISATAAAKEISALQYRKTEEQVYMEISNIYYNAQILQHQLVFINGNIRNTEKLLENIKLLRDQLMAKSTDVNKVELQYKQLLTQKESVQANLEQAMNALKFAMGRSIDAYLETEAEIKFGDGVEYDASPTIEMKLAAAQSALLESELSTLKKFWLPNISLYGSFSQNGFGYDKAPNDFLKFFPSGFAGINFSVPIFNGTATYRKINQKEIEIRNSELQKNLIEEQTNMQRENAEKKRSIAQANIKNSYVQMDLAKSIYEKTLLQQQEGTAGTTEVLLADMAMREAQQSNLSSIVEYLRADLELKKLTGNINNN